MAQLGCFLPRHLLQRKNDHQVAWLKQTRRTAIQADLPLSRFAGNRIRFPVNGIRQTVHVHELKGLDAGGFHQQRIDGDASFVIEPGAVTRARCSFPVQTVIDMGRSSCMLCRSIQLSESMRRDRRQRSSNPPPFAPRAKDKPLVRFSPTSVRRGGPGLSWGAFRGVPTISLIAGKPCC